MIRQPGRRCAAVALLIVLLSIPSARSWADSFSLDSAPSLAGSVGDGAEDEFDLVPAGPLAPSPSLGSPFLDGAMYTGSVAGAAHTPNGNTIDAFSTNHFLRRLPASANMKLDFSIDRISTGAAGSASAAQAALSQQAGDIYRSSAAFINPAVFVGTLGVGSYAGPLASAGKGGSNKLLIDESAFGLLSGGAVVPAGADAGPVGQGTHDNVDAYDRRSATTPAGSPGAVYSQHSYFAIAPSEAITVGASAADIFDTAALTPGTSPIPYASALSMGLDLNGRNTDSIDALVMFDAGLVGGATSGGPGAEAGRDYALFSLAPGSETLGALASLGISAGDVFFTDFSGSFAVYAFAADLGLPSGMASFPFQNQSNIDALEIAVVPEPAAAVLLAVGGLAVGVRRRDA